KPRWDMMEQCDTLLVVGSSFPYSEFLPKEGQARGVQIDIDAKLVSVRYPMEVNLVGDSAETLRALMPLLESKNDRGWREQIEKGIADWWRVLEARAMNEAKPINPQRMFWELSPRLPDNCIIVADSGSAANWFARDLKVRRGMMASLSGNLATMGPGVPYAIAAKFAFADRVVLAPQSRPAWEHGLSASRPVVLDAITDPEVPTLPPHITSEEAKKFTESMIKGEPRLGHMIKQTFMEAVEGLLPHKK